MKKVQVPTETAVQLSRRQRSPGVPSASANDCRNDGRGCESAIGRL
jgi:hypothetical protein